MNNDNSQTQGNSSQRPQRAYSSPQPMSADTAQILQQQEMLSIQLYYQHLSMMEMNRHLEAVMYEVRVLRAEFNQFRASVVPGMERSSPDNSEGATAGPATPDTVTHGLNTNYQLPENNA